MKNTGKDFYNFALSESPEPSFTQWLKEIHTDFEAYTRCSICRGLDITITIDPKVILWCKDCKKYFDNIDIDKLRPIDYSAVTFLHEKKIKEILTSKQETT